ncbi:hypothetical protein [Azospirillum sp. TSO5]|uniref:hypothetical protein n=1 Tax=Azospirillum sp. TSO5 TaxID=716760 RepID=UPI0018EE6D67|nr:hypothetical protein [Azospirillum sp. TSO5]
MQEDDAGGGARSGTGRTGGIRRDPADRLGDRPQVTGVLLREPGIEEAGSFRTGKSKEPLSNKTDLFLKTMNRTITEVIS